MNFLVGDDDKLTLVHLEDGKHKGLSEDELEKKAVALARRGGKE